MYMFPYQPTKSPRLLHLLSGSQHGYGTLMELPLPFEVPLPAECTIAGTNLRTYNQGQCSRKPCHTGRGECTHSWQWCCYEVGQTSMIRFTCSDSENPLKGNVIVSCKCQPCSSLHAQIKGKVLSSWDRAPVVLAAILIGSEIASFTDQAGKFFFELTTTDREVTLLFQESRHKQLEMTLNIHPSLNHEVTVILEYIQSMEVFDKMQNGFEIQLATNTTIEEVEINASLHFPPEVLVQPENNELYLGPGQMLHSLYYRGNWPDFTAPFVHHMIYGDSQGADFSIQAFLLGSLRIMDENGRPLALRAGLTLPLMVSIKFDKLITEEDLRSLHLFVFSESESRWLDRGRVATIGVHPQVDGISTLVTIQSKLKELTPLWAIGFPMRITCWVKVRAFHRGTNQELVGLGVNLHQSDDSLGRTTFYQHTAQTVAGVGACLKSVCSLGGIISVSPPSDGVEAVPPDVKHGIIMGQKEQIMFYNTHRSQIHVDGRTPYYIAREACVQSINNPKGYFKFVSNSSALSSVRPFILAPVEQEESEGEHCFIKVAAYDCTAFTDVKVLSYDSDHHLLSFHYDIATPPTGAPPIDTCKTTVIAQLRAACVEYTCGSDIHVSVQSRPRNSSPRDCRYWSSSSKASWAVPSAHNLTSFQFFDTGSHYSRGLYQEFSQELARMKCYAGSNMEPRNSLDPYRGVAVTFTC